MKKTNKTNKTYINNNVHQEMFTISVKELQNALVRISNLREALEEIVEISNDGLVRLIAKNALEFESLRKMSHAKKIFKK